MPSSEPARDRSVLIHGKFTSEKWDFEDHILPPITTSVAFRLRSARRGAQAFGQFANPELDRATVHPMYIYMRLDDPCQGLLEETLAFAEKGECAVCFATGMAAISAALGVHLGAGQRIVSHPTIYGCTYSLMTRWLPASGVATEWVNLNDPEALRAALGPDARVVYFETPCNPTMELVDIEQVVRVVAEANQGRPESERVVTIVDNTFASPFGQRPLTMGVDFVVCSLTKHLAGFGATMGGAVIGPSRKETDLLMYRKDFGGSLSPQSAWQVLTYGLPTLAVRMEHQQGLAQSVAEYLWVHPKVARVHYPGLECFPQPELAHKQLRDIDGNFAPGSLLYFELKGEPQEAYDRAVRVIDWLAANSLAVTMSVSLGQIRTLAEHPASMTHAAMSPEDQVRAGISPGAIRLSMGLEDLRDILRDLERALDAA